MSNLLFKGLRVLIVSKVSFIVGNMAAFIRGVRDDVSINIAETVEGIHQSLQKQKSSYLILQDNFNDGATSVLVKELSEKYRDLKIIVFSVGECGLYEISDFRYLGAFGYLDMKTDEKIRTERTRKMLTGQGYFPPDIDRLGENSVWYSVLERKGLTKRQIEVLKLVIAGKKNDGIGKILAISAKTVNIHRTKAYRAIGAHCIGDVHKYAIKYGIWSYGKTGREGMEELGAA
ncbi:MAG: LuxR C-terminal-related transcriptional regulator [Spirochaetaceae bacterium]|jgi:DNA-binding NarL/FixJ family response regulator|nr:LuxR C-terminal-related transcriptional regulator [Spirochaetaceae bacterium]